MFRPLIDGFREYIMVFWGLEGGLNTLECQLRVQGAMYLEHCQAFEVCRVQDQRFRDFRDVRETLNTKQPS